jgi:hypothetical protein
MIKFYFFLLILLFGLNSCFLTDNIITDKKINQINISTSEKLKIITKVKAYSPSKEWFYGTISIENNSGKRMSFNFNQKLNVKNDILTADYNLYPVSYATEAFIIEANQTKLWNVAWHYKKEKFESTVKPQIIPDLTVQNIQ